MPSGSGGYDPYKNYGTPSGSGSTSLPSGTTDIYLPSSIADQPIIAGTTHINQQIGRGADTLPDTPITVQATQLVQQYAALSVSSPDQFASVQSLLYQAGMYGSTKPLWGVWTGHDSSAFGKALMSFVQISQTGAPITFNEWLDKAATQGAKNQAAAGTTATPQATLSDPASIRAAAQQAAQEALGHGLSDEQLSAFVARFQGKQKSAELSTASTVTAPDLGGDAMQYAQQTDPQAYTSRKQDAYKNAFLDLFLPAESQRPSITPVPSA